MTRRAGSVSFKQGNHREIIMCGIVESFLKSEAQQPDAHRRVVVLLHAMWRDGAPDFREFHDHKGGC